MRARRAAAVEERQSLITCVFNVKSLVDDTGSNYKTRPHAPKVIAK